MPFVVAGHLGPRATVALLAELERAGAAAVEVGIPFSDPLADGPTIQAATQVALENGITVRRCIDAVRELRGRGVRQPMLLMGYLNPLLSYGLEAFVQDAQTAGAAGVIVPDLPPEEGDLLARCCEGAGLALVYFLAPTSSAGRIALVTERAQGFIYMVSVTGVTGARADLPPELGDFIGRVRAQTTKPLVLGFGIGRPEQARAVSKIVDGFIVGSALVKAGASGAGAVRELAASLRKALD